MQIVKSETLVLVSGRQRCRNGFRDCNTCYKEEGSMHTRRRNDEYANKKDITEREWRAIYQRAIN